MSKKYIDADALLDKIERMWNAHQLTNTKYKTFVDLLKAEPAADVRENVRGEWVDRNGNIVFPFWERYECSECGARSDNKNFCPNCGADMRGDVDGGRT